MIVVYAGPTISHVRIRELIDCVCLPPVRHGDLLSLIPRKPVAIGIIDGYFEGAASIWHKEILYAIDQGIKVYGSASMGALRAAELDCFGMVGVGQIYEDFKNGLLTDDDEVAVLHGPEEVEYMVASTPMINIRATLELACVQKIIDSDQKMLLLDAAKNTYYKKRSWSALIDYSADTFGSNISASLALWLECNKIDQKQLDAVHMLSVLSQIDTQAHTASQSNFYFEWTQVWHSAFAEFTPQSASSQVLSERDQKVINQLSLKPDQYERFLDKALIRRLVNRQSNELNNHQAIKAAFSRFRAENHLYSRDLLMDYLTRIELDESQLTVLMREVSQLESIKQEAGDMRTAVIDQLKLDGQYPKLLQLADQKLEAIGTEKYATQCVDVDRATVLSWYFEQQLGEQIPVQLAGHLDKTGFSSVEEFYRSIVEDYVYCQQHD